jgi:hypothetical protein
MRKSMAVLVQKYWNDTAGVILEGVAVRFSSNKSYLFVLNAQGVKIAHFRAQDVERYWIEASPSTHISSLDKTMTDIG